jgi:hypothetical protein
MTKRIAAFLTLTIGWACSAGWHRTVGLGMAIIFTPVVIYCWKGCASN